MGPTRLLDTRRGFLARSGGLERELLRSALTEVAPEATRARVLQTVGQVLAALQPAALQLAALQPAALQPAAKAPVPSSTNLGTKLALALKSVNALYLGASVTAAAATGVLAHQWAVTSRSGAGQAVAGRSAIESAVAGQARHAELQASRQANEPATIGSMLTRPAAAVAAPPVAALEPAADGEGALANTSSRAPHIHAGEPAHGNHSKPHLDSSARYAVEEEPADWLGAQLQLLGEAREQLETGRLVQAAEVLDSYERRFPGGVIGPQVRMLRTDLRERRAQAVDAP